MKMTPLGFSKSLYPQAMDRLAPIAPGLFFEISLAWGRPELQEIFLNDLTPHMGYYSRIALLLFCAYFIGYTAMMATALVQFFMRLAYPGTSHVCAILPETMRSVCSRLMGEGWITRKATQVAVWKNARNQELDRAGDLAYEVWTQAAARLMKERYGIDAPAEASDLKFEVWYGLLGTASPEQMKGSGFVRAMYSAGWLGLAAFRGAPMLPTHHSYVALCVLLIVMGLINDLYFARRWGSTIRDIMNRTICVLKEIPKGEMGGKGTKE